MAEQIEHSDGERQTTGSDASREISSRLSAAARKLRFSTSSRSSLYQAVGLRPRLMDRIFTGAVIFLTVLYVVLPNLISLAYFGYLASPQYESETRFTVRSSTPALGKDQIGAVTGIPAAKIVQDTQIVVNFIKSHEMLDVLRKNTDLRRTFGDPSIDWWARLPEDVTAEDLLDYWDDRVSVSVSASSGIVTVKARAFTAEDSALLVREILKASEVVVNQVNDRIWKDVVTTAQENLESSKTQLKATREALGQARNQTGVLSVEGSSAILTNLISAAEGERLKLLQRYNTQLSAVSKDAPQMRVLKREIDSKEQQIADLNSRVAGQNVNSRNLADVSQDLSQLQLAQTLAEENFSASLKTLEQVQFVSRQQLLYLDSFLAPRIPDRAEFPKRGLWIAVTLAVSLILWVAALGILQVVRKQLSH